MEVFPAIFITIIIILFIIIIVVVIILTTETPPPKLQCTKDSDCSSGYICESNICKAGTGTVCVQDSDCESSLICLNKICISNQKNDNIHFPQFPNIIPDQKINLKNTNLQKENKQLNISTQPPPIQHHKINFLPKQKQTIKLLRPETHKKLLTIDENNLKIIDHMIKSQEIFQEPRNIIVKKENVKKYISYSSSSSDDEINSEGDFSDQPFDIRSDDDSYESSSENSGSEIFDCLTTNENIGEYRYINSVPIIDICSYSNITIFLLNDNNIICEVDENLNYRYKVSNNISIKKILTFDGYIYSVSNDDKLYILSNSYLNALIWKWESVPWAPENIKYISSTYDSLNLWIQTDTDGFLFKENGKLISTQKIIDIKRVYGKDIDHYLDIDINQFTAISFPDKEKINNVVDGILNYYNKIIYISFDEIDKYRSIVIINWKPYYIKW